MKHIKSVFLAIGLALASGTAMVTFTGCQFAQSDKPVAPEPALYRSIQTSQVAMEAFQTEWYRQFRVKEKANLAIKDSDPEKFKAQSKVLEDKLTEANIRLSTYQAIIRETVKNWIAAKLANGEALPITPEKEIVVTAEIEEAEKKAKEVAP